MELSRWRYCRDCGEAGVALGDGLTEKGKKTSFVFAENLTCRK